MKIQIRGVWLRQLPGGAILAVPRCKVIEASGSTTEADQQQKRR